MHTVHKHISGAESLQKPSVSSFDEEFCAAQNQAMCMHLLWESVLRLALMLKSCRLYDTHAKKFLSCRTRKYHLLCREFWESGKVPLTEINRILEWFGSEVTLKDHLLQTLPAMDGHSVHYIRLLKTPSNLTFNSSYEVAHPQFPWTACFRDLMSPFCVERLQ